MRRCLERADVSQVIQKTWTVSDLSSIRKLEEDILDAVRQFGYSEPAQFSIRLAVGEAVNNGIRHGNRRDEAKRVRVDLLVDANHTSVTVTDEGPGFSPDNVPDPTRDENLDKPSGRGIMLIRAYMDEVSYNEQGNQVYMVKKRH